MDLTNTLWLDARIADIHRKTSNRRNRSQGDWDGYCSEVLDTTGSDEAVRNDIGRRRTHGKSYVRSLGFIITVLQILLHLDVIIVLQT